MANINKRMRQNVENMKRANEDKQIALKAQEKIDNRKYNLRFGIMMIVYAAIYFGITYLTRDFAYDIHQFRIAEIMIALVFFDPAAFPGVCLGCLLSNIIGPFGLIDAFLGTCATAFGIYAMKWWSEKKGKPYIGMALYAFFNAFMVALERGYLDHYVTQYSLPEALFWILLGEVVCAVLGGTILHFIVSKRWEDIVSETKKGQVEEFHPGTLQ